MANIVLLKPSKWLYNKSMKKLTLPQLCRPTTPSAVSVPPTKPKLKTKIAEELREVFRHLDSDKDGKISAEELRNFLAGVGEEVSVSVAEAAIDGLDSGGDGKLEFEDFVALMEMKSGSSGDDEELELKMAFEVFEGVKGCGRITAKGVQRVLRWIGEERSLRDCEAMIRAYDLDGNGELDFHEFHSMMTFSLTHS
ncbi:hypothetical protein J5N97_000983 [Dioscorea zingiberensis]|uniref:EF-hand domain-containing protein n=1 Tax=Dioscorea zingiberensis TaxID=325984 RepID=A0A9D5H2S1_9LILI|nr:hypothetical protein J5N97_000983 [Dioscorea zingiberensis]